MNRFSSIALAAALLLAQGVAAAPNEDKIRSILPEIQAAVVQQDVIDALRTHNQRHADISRATIDQMEATWQSEIESTNRPLISSVVDSPVAERMRGVAEATGIEDIVIICAHGLSVAQSTTGIEIWMGQNPAFVKTIQTGPNAVFIDEVNFNEATQSYQSRVSFTVADPDTGKPIGAVSVGFNADAL